MTLNYSEFFPGRLQLGVEGTAMPATRNVNRGDWTSIANGTLLGIGDIVQYMGGSFSVGTSHTKDVATATPPNNANYILLAQQGINGSTTYTWFAYADSADGLTNFTTGSPGSRTYIGVSPNQTEVTEGTNPAAYTWSKIQGPAGPVINVKPDKAGFAYIDGELNPPTQTVTYTATLENVSGTINWSTSPNVKSGTGNTFTLNNSEVGANQQIAVTATVGAYSQTVIFIKIADPLSDPTNANTAAAINNQGALATLNAANYYGQVSNAPKASVGKDLLDPNGVWKGGLTATGYQGFDPHPINTAQSRLSFQGSIVVEAGPRGQPMPINKVVLPSEQYANINHALAFKVDGFDYNKSYIFLQWAKTNAGAFFYGPTEPVNSLANVTDSNPYWVNSFAGTLGPGNFPGTWCLMVGVVHGAGYDGGDTGVAGLYNESGIKIADWPEYKESSDWSWQGSRTIIYGTAGQYVNTTKPVMLELSTASQSIEQMFATMGATVGVNVKNSIGAILAQAALVTAEGQAASIVSQSPWATYNSGDTPTTYQGRVTNLSVGGLLGSILNIANRRLTLLKRDDGTTDVTEGAIVTSQGQAATIASQSLWATYNSGDTPTNYQGRVANLSTGGLLSSILNITNRNLTLLKRADGTTDVTEAAVVTSQGQAATIASQSLWATYSSGDTPTTYQGRVTNLSSTGLLGSIANITNRNLTLLKRADGTTDVTEAAVVTSQGQAATIASQSLWATYSSGDTPTTYQGRVTNLSSTGLLGSIANITNRNLTLLKRADGTTDVTEAAVVTSQGVAASIINQGSLALLNSVTYGTSNVQGFGGLAAKSAVAWNTADVSNKPAALTTLETVGGIERLRTDYITHPTTNVLLHARWPQEGGANVTETRVAASITNQGNLATRQQASLPFGGNSVVDSEFSNGVAAFRAGGTNSNGTNTYPTISGINNPGYSGLRQVLFAHVNTSGANWPSSGGNYYDTYSSKGMWNGSLDDMRKYAVPVKVNDRVAYRSLIGVHRCNCEFFCLVYDKDGVLLAANVTTGGRAFGGANGDPANFDEIGQIFTVTQSTAAYAQLMWRMLPLNQADPYLFFTEPLLSVVPTGQTVLPAYTPGRPSVVPNMEYAAGRIINPRLYNTQTVIGVSNATNLLITYTVGASNITVNIPAHNRVVASTTGPQTLSYGAGSAVVSYNSVWWAYVDDAAMLGISSPTYGITGNPTDLLYPHRYTVASGKAPNSSGSGGTTQPGQGGGGGGTVIP